MSDPLPVARWLSETLRRGQTPHLVSFTTPAIQLCQAAEHAGLDIRGAEMSIGGEPTTPARLAALDGAGVRAVTGYASTEAGGIAAGCLNPAAPDDVHFMQDRHALVQPRDCPETGALPPDALLFTSLRPSAPLVLLNVSLGDQARVAPTECGCPLQSAGWTTHLREVRSFEKLTAGGMTFLDSAVIRVLEEVLPGRFGGGPADYQLVEWDADGAPHLTLVVHPRLGPLDEESLASAFLAALGTGSGADRVMALQWRQSHLVRVERRPPIATASGKVLHLHEGRAGLGLEDAGPTGGN